MNEILSWLGWGAGGLLLVAVAVAGWEHLVREATGQRTDCGARAEDRCPGMAVDVRLDTQAAALAGEAGEQAEAAAQTDRDTRLAAMTQALSRAAEPPRQGGDSALWLDTTPRVVGLDEPVLRERDQTGRAPSRDGAGQPGQRQRG